MVPLYSNGNGWVVSRISFKSKSRLTISDYTRKLHRQLIRSLSREVLIKLDFPVSLLSCCRSKKKRDLVKVQPIHPLSVLSLRPRPLHSKILLYLLYLTTAKQILFQCILGWIFPFLWPWCSWFNIFIEVLEDRVTVIEPHHLSFVDPEIPSEKILFNVTVPLLPGQGKCTYWEHGSLLLN